MKVFFSDVDFNYIFLNDKFEFEVPKINLDIELEGKCEVHKLIMLLQQNLKDLVTNLIYLMNNISIRKYMIKKDEFYKFLRENNIEITNEILLCFYLLKAKANNYEILKGDRDFRRVIKEIYEKNEDIGLYIREMGLFYTNYVEVYNYYKNYIPIVYKGKSEDAYLFCPPLSPNGYLHLIDETLHYFKHLEKNVFKNKIIDIINDRFDKRKYDEHLYRYVCDERLQECFTTEFLTNIFKKENFSTLTKPIENLCLFYSQEINSMSEIDENVSINLITKFNKNLCPTKKELKELYLKTCNSKNSSLISNLLLNISAVLKDILKDEDVIEVGKYLEFIINVHPSTLNNNAFFTYNNDLENKIETFISIAQRDQSKIWLFDYINETMVYKNNYKRSVRGDILFGLPIISKASSKEDKELVSLLFSKRYKSIHKTSSYDFYKDAKAFIIANKL